MRPCRGSPALAQAGWNLESDGDDDRPERRGRPWPATAPPPSQVLPVRPSGLGALGGSGEEDEEGGGRLGSMMAASARGGGGGAGVRAGP